MDQSIVIPAQPEHLADLRRFARECAAGLGADRGAVDGLVQAVDELAANTIAYGYRGGPGEIELRLRREGGVLVAVLRDQAPLFDPTTVPPPDFTRPMEERAHGGFGIFLARSFVDSMEYRVTAAGENEVILRKTVEE